METIAVYWEPVIKVYGFEIREDLCLFSLTFDSMALTELSSFLAPNDTEEEKFVFTTLGQDSERTTLHTVMPAQAAGDLETRIASNQPLKSVCTVSTRHQVEALFFHGPHFQDRYGIVSRIDEAFRNSGLTVHSTGCCGTSIYLILDAGQATLARDLLASNFTVPKTA